MTLCLHEFNKLFKPVKSGEIRWTGIELCGLLVPRNREALLAFPPASFAGSKMDG